MLETLLSNRTVSVLWEALPRILSAGLTMTIPLTLVSFTLAMVLAVAVALVQYARVPVLSQLARFYIWVIRGTPVLVQLFVVFYGLPGVGILIEPFPAAVLVFSINEGAYCAETIRAALDAITDYGRPNMIRLAVLVDRGDPEYPIRADYVGFKLDLDPAHKVAVQFDEDGDEAGIFEVNWQQKPLNR